VKVCAKYGENSRYFDLNVSARGQRQQQQQEQQQGRADWATAVNMQLDTGSYQLSRQLEQLKCRHQYPWVLSSSSCMIAFCHATCSSSGAWCPSFYDTAQIQFMHDVSFLLS
jgi:hypothetical protein